MAIGSTSRQNSFAIKEEKHDSWDPVVTLGINNPDTKTFTCVGYAPSKRRRCQNVIAGCNQTVVFAILHTLALLSPSSSKIGQMLPEIASLSLCRRYHQNQADSVVAKWQANISSLRLKTIRTKSWRVYEDHDSSSIRHPNVGKKTSSQTRQPFSERRGENPWTPNKNSQSSTYDEQRHSEKKYHERKGCERYKEEEQRKEEKSKEEEKKKQERQEEERREEERREQQIKEQIRKEQERKEKEQRERAAQNERIRRAAQKKREEQERQRQEQAAKEKKEWEQSWATFISRWTAFKSTTTPHPHPQAPLTLHGVIRNQTRPRNQRDYSLARKIK
jgi:hypothetical protein